MIESERSDQAGDFELRSNAEAEIQNEQKKDKIKNKVENSSDPPQQKISENIPKDLQNINQQNISDLLHCGHPQHLSNISLDRMNLDKLENSDFYQALNMPLQIKGANIDNNYMTYQTNKTL